MGYMTSKYGGRCEECGDRIDVGDEIFWDPEEKTISHKECHQDQFSNASSPIKPVQRGVTVKSPPTLHGAEQGQPTMGASSDLFRDLQKENIVRGVIKEIIERCVHDHDFSVSEQNTCLCIKCQLESLDAAAIAKAVFGLLEKK